MTKAEEHLFGFKEELESVLVVVALWQVSRILRVELLWHLRRQNDQIVLLLLLLSSWIYADHALGWKLELCQSLRHDRQFCHSDLICLQQLQWVICDQVIEVILLVQLFLQDGLLHFLIDLIGFN